MHRTAALASATVLALIFTGAACAQQPLSIAQEGYFFVGGKLATINGREVMSGQAYVEFQIPVQKTQAYPIVIIPGAAQTRPTSTARRTAVRAGPSCSCAAVTPCIS